MSIKAVIFDLDGTIADTIESMKSAGNKVLAKCGLKGHESEAYQYFAGDGAKELVRRALIAAGDVNCVHFDDAYSEYQMIFEQDCTYQVTVFEGMKAVLDTLKASGIKIAVLTNKPHERAMKVLDYLFGKDYFDAVIGEGIGFEKKPDENGAIYLANQFGLDVTECMYVGDTNVDMQTGKRAGMYTVGVLWGFRDRKELEENKADVIIDTPLKLLELVK